jgi:two-component system response regulator PilR (NtrC family)
VIQIGDIQEEILLRSVLDTVSDGVTIIDPNLRIVYHNEAIRKMFGDITGKLCYEAYRGRVEPCVDCTILKVLKDGKQRKTLSDTLGPEGQVMWMECVSGPLMDKQGNIIGAVEIVRDETEQMRISKEYATIKREMERQARFENIVTQSKVMKLIFGLIEKVAPTNSTVLITGESGTGKELIARAIHSNSKRKDDAFVSVNCAAIPEDLLESELFGHVMGAFTGATRNHPGLIYTANNGTLFLDEVGEIPQALQVKLLRFLQDGSCRRVGDTESQTYDVRIIGATNRDLEEAVKDGVFREDFFFRLNVIPIYLPPLRDRREDIAPIANHVLHKMCEAHSRQVTGISSKTLKKFMDYPWPGNIREMENVIEYALHLAEDNHAIEDEHLPPKMLNNMQEAWAQSDLVSIEEFTRRSIAALQSEHTEEQIAEILGISRKNLWEKRKRWGLQRPISAKRAPKAFEP